MNRFIANLFLSSLFLLSFIFACQKEEIGFSRPSLIDRSISIDEVKTIFGSGGAVATLRNGGRIPLGMALNWQNAYSVNMSGVPLIFVEADTSTAVQNQFYGNFITFHKDDKGKIVSNLITWEADSVHPYSLRKDPLNINRAFSGKILLVDNQDTVRAMIKMQNGSGVAFYKGAFCMCDIEINFNSNTAVNRDGPDPASKCNWWWSRFRRNFRDWWYKLSSGLSGFFSTSGNTWDDENGENTDYPYLSFFFGGEGRPLYGVPTNPNYGNDQLFSEQLVKCQAIKDFVLSMGSIPEGYSDLDIKYCTLIDELGLTGNDAKCIYKLFGTGYLNDIYDTWVNSSKSESDRVKLINFVKSYCEGDFTINTASLLKEKFCLDESLIEVHQKLLEKGITSPNGTLTIELVQAIEEMVFDELSFISQEHKIFLLNNPSLVCDIVSFFAANKNVKNIDRFISAALKSMSTEDPLNWDWWLSNYPNFDLETFDDWDGINTPPWPCPDPPTRVDLPNVYLGNFTVPEPPPTSTLGSVGGSPSRGNTEDLSYCNGDDTGVELKGKDETYLWLKMQELFA